jgi:phage terminase small subunit
VRRRLFHPAVEAAQRARAERTQVTADNVLNVAAAIAFFDIRRLFDEDGRLKHLKDIPPDVAVAVASYERTKHGARVRMADKIAALTLLFKHLGLSQGRLHITGDWEKHCGSAKVQACAKGVKRSAREEPNV